jgi:AbiV family abortive infection protein
MSFIAAVRWQDALKGAIASCDNAERLCKDAIILLNKGTIQTSFAVSLLAWEETNKAGMLLKSYVEKADISKTQWDDKYRSHVYKLQAYPIWIDVLDADSKKPDKDKVVQQSSDVGKRYDVEKQLYGFYVDRNPDGGWNTPNVLSGPEQLYLNQMTPFWINNVRLTVATLRQRIDELGSTPPLTQTRPCKRCGAPMTLLDEGRWYCYKDELVFYAKKKRWIEYPSEEEEARRK